MSTKTIKKYIKNKLKTLRVNYHRRFNAFSTEDLIHAARGLGAGENDILLVHVSYDRFIAYTSKPTELLEGLRRLVGEGGTLCMPSMPFTDTAYRYINSGKTFDVKRTPSAMGLVTELFRRSAGTRRSLHPTHPVLANGPQADRLLQDHIKAETPCGRHSPFAGLAELGGKILLLGTGINVLTFFHYLEELHENDMPESPFMQERFKVDFKGYDGEALRIETRLFDPQMSKRRNLGILENALKADGHWHESRVGSLDMVLLDVEEVMSTFKGLIERKTYCYD